LMVVYVDTSVALAHLFAEDRCPPDSLWQARLVTSRLTHYEAWNRVHARAAGESHGPVLRAILDRIAIVELTAPALARALEAFPRPVRTLNALHPASIEFLRQQGLDVRLASYDERMLATARLLGIDVLDV
jgi:hypothetical protein